MSDKKYVIYNKADDFSSGAFNSMEEAEAEWEEFPWFYGDDAELIEITEEDYWE